MNLVNVKLSKIQMQWKHTCLFAEKGLMSGKYKTVVAASKALGVNSRMLARYAKRLGINLNLKGHGVKVPEERYMLVEDLPRECCKAVSIWNNTFYKER